MVRMTTLIMEMKVLVMLTRWPAQEIAVASVLMFTYSDCRTEAVLMVVLTETSCVLLF